MKVLLLHEFGAQITFPVSKPWDYLNLYSKRDTVIAGHVKEIKNPPSKFYCSPLGLVPKRSNGVQSGWRMIFDLSSPEGYSVNDGIPTKCGSIFYETLNDAMCLVAQAGRGAVMMRRDLKSTFRHIPVNPNDYWLLIFEWNGKFFYIDMFLPFGLRQSWRGPGELRAARPARSKLVRPEPGPSPIGRAYWTSQARPIGLGLSVLKFRAWPGPARTRPDAAMLILSM